MTDLRFCASVCLHVCTMWQARVIPRPAFAVGLDTAMRILDPKYYGGLEARDAMLQEMRQLGVRFVVAGRLSQPSEGKGVFETLDTKAASIPQRYRDMFLGLSEKQFRIDLSSSQLRRQAAIKP